MENLKKLLPIFTKSIQVDIEKYPKISDVQKLIADDLHIKNSQLTIDNQPPEQKIKNLPNNYTFQISINSFCPNLDFYFPDGKIIQIKNGYQMNIGQIIKSLQKEDINYSNNCFKKNFCLTVSGRKLKKTDFPFFSAQPDTKIKVELIGDIVTLNYGEKKFTFSENEPINDVLNYIRQSFTTNSLKQPDYENMIFQDQRKASFQTKRPQSACSKYNTTPNVNINNNNVSVSILNDQNRKINGSELLKSFIKYTVIVDKTFVFCHIKKENKINLTMDYLSTVSDAQKYLSVQSIYNSNKNDLSNDNQLFDSEDLNYDESDDEKPRRARSKKKKESSDSDEELSSSEDDEENTFAKMFGLVNYQNRNDTFSRRKVSSSENKKKSIYSKKETKMSYQRCNDKFSKRKSDSSDSDEEEDIYSKKETKMSYQKRNDKFSKRKSDSSDSDDEDLIKNNKIKPENFIIYDSNKKEITDDEMKLIDIQDSNQIFYYKISFDKKKPKKDSESEKPTTDSESEKELNSSEEVHEVKKKKRASIKKPKLISVKTDEIKKTNKKKSDKSIEITFLFEKTNKKKFDPITKDVSLDSTMKEVEQMILDECGIEDKFKIILKYKIKSMKVQIDQEMTIEDIIDEIKEEDDESGKLMNVLYVTITPSKTKVSSPAASDDDDDNKNEIERLKKIIKEKDHQLNKQKEENSKEIKKLMKKVNEFEKQKGKNKKKTDTKSDDDNDDDEKKENEDEYHIQFLSVSQIDSYTRQKTLGTGATSTVVKVSHTYALKIFNANFCKPDKNDSDSEESKSSTENEEEDEDENENDKSEESVEIDFEKMKKFFKEYEIINKLKHPNIIKTFGICFGDKKHRPSILLEYCPNNLKSCIKSLKAEERIQIIIEIIEAMKHVHSLGLIHRDLKPENILLDSNKHVKLSDFGLCAIANTDYFSKSLTKMAGTAPFMAPELVQEKSDYNSKVDVYAFGVVVYMIMAKGEYPKIKQYEVGNGKKAKIPSYFSNKAKELINMCWITEPEERPSFDDLFEFVESNKDDIYAKNTNS